MFKKILSLAVVFSFFLTSLGPLPKADADTSLNLPQPGTMVELSAAFSPVVLKGMVVYPKEPLRFDFIIDAGDSGLTAQAPALRQETDRLIKYFLTALTVPENDLWVNLSPYEKNRVIPLALGQTILGKDLLSQDYILKQLTASLIYPEKQLGHEFWQKVYAQAQKKFGTTNVPVNTFNKVWILPDQAEIYDRNGAVYVTKAHLKVMLDEDYMSLQNHGARLQADTHSIGANIIRQVILPQIEKEVNTGKNFALVRQMYFSLILAKWYKETIKESLLSQVYQDKNKIKGVDLSDKSIKDRIYARYIQAYKKGVFNYIREEESQDPGSKGQGIFPRKYFSGGLEMITRITHARTEPAGLSKPAIVANVNLKNFNEAMSVTLVNDSKVSSIEKVSETMERLVKLYYEKEDAFRELFFKAENPNYPIQDEKANEVLVENDWVDFEGKIIDPEIRNIIRAAVSMDDDGVSMKFKWPIEEQKLPPKPETLTLSKPRSFNHFKELMMARLNDINQQPFQLEVITPSDVDTWFILSDIGFTQWIDEANTIFERLRELIKSGNVQVVSSQESRVQLRLNGNEELNILLPSPLEVEYLIGIIGKTSRPERSREISKFDFSTAHLIGKGKMVLRTIDAEENLVRELRLDDPKKINLILSEDRINNIQADLKEELRQLNAQNIEAIASFQRYYTSYIESKRSKEQADLRAREELRKSQEKALAKAAKKKRRDIAIALTAVGLTAAAVAADHFLPADKNPVRRYIAQQHVNQEVLELLRKYVVYYPNLRPVVAGSQMKFGTNDLNYPFDTGIIYNNGLLFSEHWLRNPDPRHMEALFDIATLPAEKLASSLGVTQDFFHGPHWQEFRTRLIDLIIQTPGAMAFAEGKLLDHDTLRKATAVRICSILLNNDNSSPLDFAAKYQEVFPKIFKAYRSLPTSMYTTDNFLQMAANIAKSSYFDSMMQYDDLYAVLDYMYQNGTEPQRIKILEILACVSHNHPRDREFGLKYGQDVTSRHFPMSKSAHDAQEFIAFLDNTAKLGQLRALPQSQQDQLLGRLIIIVDSTDHVGIYTEALRFMHELGSNFLPHGPLNSDSLLNTQPQILDIAKLKSINLQLGAFPPGSLLDASYNNLVDTLITNARSSDPDRVAEAANGFAYMLRDCNLKALAFEANSYKLGYKDPDFIWVRQSDAYLKGLPSVPDGIFTEAQRDLMAKMDRLRSPFDDIQQKIDNNVKFVNNYINSHGRSVEPNNPETTEMQTMLENGLQLAQQAPPVYTKIYQGLKTELSYPIPRSLWNGTVVSTEDLGVMKQYFDGIPRGRIFFSERYDLIANKLISTLTAVPRADTNYKRDAQGILDRLATGLNTVAQQYQEQRASSTQTNSTPVFNGFTNAVAATIAQLKSMQFPQTLPEESRLRYIGILQKVRQSDGLGLYQSAQEQLGRLGFGSIPGTNLTPEQKVLEGNFSRILRDIANRARSHATDDADKLQLQTIFSTSKDPANIREASRLLQGLQNPAMNGRNEGGIDLKNINVTHKGPTTRYQFDPALDRSMITNGVAGFLPVIVRIINIPSAAPYFDLHQKSSI